MNNKIFINAIFFLIILSCNINISGENYFPLKKGLYWFYKGYTFWPSPGNNLESEKYNDFYKKYNIKYNEEELKQFLKRKAIYIVDEVIFKREIVELNKRNGKTKCTIFKRKRIYLRFPDKDYIDITDDFKKMYINDYNKILRRIINGYEWNEKLTIKNDHIFNIFVRKIDVVNVEKISSLYHFKNIKEKEKKNISIDIDLISIKEGINISDYESRGEWPVKINGIDILSKLYYLPFNPAVSHSQNCFYFQKNVGIIAITSGLMFYRLYKYGVKN